MKSKTPGRHLKAILLRASVVCLATLQLAFGEEPSPREAIAQSAYQSAKAEHESAPQDVEAAWQFGRACFNWAEFSTNDIQRAALAQEGIRACESAIEQEPDSAPANYYLGMNQGQLARTMNLGALKLVTRMDSHFQKARELRPDFDQGGPDRNLGLLYLEAPGWPVSVGNRSKARSHLHKAVEVAPLFPENRLNLMEAYDRWDQSKLLQRELIRWDENLEAARLEFSGSRWQEQWEGWEQRIKLLRDHLSKAPPDLRSPRARG
jgi:tetratricopeptide (TPR) repeat protein